MSDKITKRRWEELTERSALEPSLIVGLGSRIARWLLGGSGWAFGKRR